MGENARAKSSIRRWHISSIPLMANIFERNIDPALYKCLLATIACIALIGLPHDIFFASAAILLLKEYQYGCALVKVKKKEKRKKKQGVSLCVERKNISLKRENHFGTKIETNFMKYRQIGTVTCQWGNH